MPQTYMTGQTYLDRGQPMRVNEWEGGWVGDYDSDQSEPEKHRAGRVNKAGRTISPIFEPKKYLHIYETERPRISALPRLAGQRENDCDEKERTTTNVREVTQLPCKKKCTTSSAPAVPPLLSPPTFPLTPPPTNRNQTQPPCNHVKYWARLHPKAGGISTQSKALSDRRGVYYRQAGPTIQLPTRTDV